MSSRPSIFITGAAAGIGRATAVLFASRGWYVGLFDVDLAGVDGLRRQLGENNALSGKLDVTDAAAVQSALEQFFKTAGERLDVMFNNAGIVAVADFGDVALARHHAIVDVNLKGVMNGAWASLPLLKATRGSRMISMCSASALYGSPSYASYGATKFAVKGLSEALDLEWRRHGIRVMDVMPLFVNTAMVTNITGAPKSLTRLGVRLQAPDIAAVVWRAANWRLWPRVHWYPGWQTQMLALTQKLMPAWLNRLTTRLVAGY
jgi:NAD(P)-dependent dehydrogenase (short-subunit alcohol dehydrogenase family)